MHLHVVLFRRQALQRQSFGVRIQNVDPVRQDLCVRTFDMKEDVWRDLDGLETERQLWRIVKVHWIVTVWRN